MQGTLVLKAVMARDQPTVPPNRTSAAHEPPTQNQSNNQDGPHDDSQNLEMSFSSKCKDSEDR